MSVFFFFFFVVVVVVVVVVVDAIGTFFVAIVFNRSLYYQRVYYSLKITAFSPLSIWSPKHFVL